MPVAVAPVVQEEELKQPVAPVKVVEKIQEIVQKPEPTQPKETVKPVEEANQEE